MGLFSNCNKQDDKIVELEKENATLKRTIEDLKYQINDISKASYLYGDDYIVKPVSFDVLKAKIDEVVDRHNKLR